MNIKQTEKILKFFVEKNNIKGFCPQVIGEIANMDKGDLWNLTCNLVEAYFQKNEN